MSATALSCSVANRSSTHRERGATNFNRDTAARGHEDAVAEALRRELVKLIERQTPAEGRNDTAIPQLKLHRWSQPIESATILMEPAVYVVVPLHVENWIRVGASAPSSHRLSAEDDMTALG